MPWLDNARWLMAARPMPTYRERISILMLIAPHVQKWFSEEQILGENKTRNLRICRRLLKWLDLWDFTRLQFTGDLEPIRHLSNIQGRLRHFVAKA